MPESGLVAIAAALAVVCLIASWMRRAPRRLGTAPAVAGHRRPGAAPAEASPAEIVHDTDLGVELGVRATLVQFSTAFCQPCRATRRTLRDVANTVPGVAHVEVDAESHLDLVRRLDIRRTPTVLVLDGAGRVIRRASGQPRKADVLAALGAAVS